MADVEIYHNPECGNSRNVRAMLRHGGIEVEVIEYLKSPPSKERLRDLVDLMGRSVRDVMRQRGTPYAELGLGRQSLTDEDLLDAMMAHPLLIDRPIVVTPTRVKLCRPSDTVLDLMDTVPRENRNKDDGSPFLRDVSIGPIDDLVDAMRNAGLPFEDLGEPGRTFFRYELLGGTVVGFGGFELYGTDVLLRSIASTQSVGANVGHTLALLLMSRAFDAGARRAHVLTPGAGPFFAKLGFTPIDRADAPASIRATRQASALCPASTPLLTRRIGV